jgi:hypothetical protein
MSIRFDPDRGKFVVRWWEGGKRRCRRFDSESDAVAFEAALGGVPSHGTQGPEADRATRALEARIARLEARRPDRTRGGVYAYAKALGADRCLGLLLLAREFDAESYEVMATALRELNPVLGADVISSDARPRQVTIEAAGARGVQARSANVPGVAIWRLLDFFDPNDLQQGTAIKLRVIGPGGRAAQTSRVFPFGGATASVDDVTVSCRLGGSTMGPTAPVTGPGIAPGAPPPPPPEACTRARRREPAPGGGNRPSRSFVRADGKRCVPPS